MTSSTALRPRALRPRALRPRKGRRALAAAPLLLFALLAAACSSSAHSTASASATTSASAAKALAAATCQQIGAVLSDGPDPDADPLGYAQAQIRPLRHITVSNPALRTVVGQLSDAYQQFYTSNGKSTDAKEAVAVATKKLNSICPGAAS